MEVYSCSLNIHKMLDYPTSTMMVFSIQSKCFRVQEFFTELIIKS